MRTIDDQDGFTLVELLVVTMISAFLALAIAAAFTVGVQTVDTANARLTASRGAPISTSYFPADVQSAAGISLSGTPCTAAVPDVATLTWVDVDSAGASTTKSALYTCQANGAVRDLVRKFTAGGTTTTSTVAFGVTAAAVSCSPDCTAPATATLTATSGGFTFAVSGRRRIG